MIGIMSSPSQKATPGQPQNMDEDDPSIKSPSSGAAKMSTIMSFFKPKLASENSLDKLRQVNADDPPASRRKEIPRSDCELLDKSKSKNRGKGKRLEVIRKGRKCGDADLGKDGAKWANNFGASMGQDTLKSGNNAKDHDAASCKNISLKAAKKDGSLDGRLGKSNGCIDSSRRRDCPKGDEKLSKKRKKNAEFDSSSDDFEVDKRKKMPKNEPLEINGYQEITIDEVLESQTLTSDACQYDAVSPGSSEDIFEVEEVPGNPKVISYLDFLNESMEKNGDEKSEIITDDKTETLQTEETTKVQDVGQVQQVSENLSHRTSKLVPKEDKPNLKKDVKSETKIPQIAKKPIKSSTTTMKKQISTKKKSEDVPCKKSSDQKEKTGDEGSSASHQSDDDSVLMLSCSEFLEDKLNSAKQRESPASLQFSKPKQKLVTVEAQVHIPPNYQPLRPASDRNSPVNSDLATIDLCHSPDSRKTPVSKKRTSNVVVSMSDVDLMIVSTDDASSAAENRKSTTVYSIFKKKGNMGKSKETESKVLKKPEQPGTSQIEPDVPGVKAKVGRPRKHPKVAALTLEKTPSNSPRKTSRSLRKDQPKTQNRRQAKRALKAIFGAKSEEENTEEEFEEKENKKIREVSSRKRVKAKRLGSSSDESQEEDDRGRDLRKYSKRMETVVMTSTPKSKNNKNAKAQDLLRKAKSRQMKRASPLPFQVKDAKLAAQGMEAATKRGKSATQRHKSELRNQTRNQRDLTSVLGRKVTPKEVADDGRGKAKTRKDVAKGKAAVEERKPTKLAPMFTKEGRLSLAKKQKSLDGQTSNPCMIILHDDDDDASRDSIRSDAGGDMGGAKLMSDAISRSKESEAERSYPPFPTISHVLQTTSEIEGSMDWWNLPFPNSFGKFLIRDRELKSFFGKNFRIADRLVRLGEFTHCSEDKEPTLVSKSFNGHPELSYDVQRIILDQIKAANPRFPVNRVFKRYLAKRKGEPSVPKHSQGETTSESKCIPQTDANFTKLKAEKPSSAKRKSEVLEQRANTKRRRVARDGSAENSEAEFVGKIRLRRRSSRWVIRDAEDEEKEAAAEQTKPRRSSRQSEQATKSESSPKVAKEGRTLRMRRGKNAGKEEAKMHGKKERSAEADDAKAKETRADKLAGLLWTDKYQPVTSTEVIGNPQAMKRLTGWLTEWKKKTDRIKKKMKRQRGRQQNKMLQVEDSDSDFGLGSASDNSDSDDDDDSLSYAMMIVGPSGCGKTAAVYACAKELGFKVFEVNASSKRTGKQILADLGEATQSHHLSTHHRGNNSTGAVKSFFAAKSPPNVSAKPKAKETTPIPKAFAAFYKAGADTAAARQGGKKTKAPHKSPKRSQVKPSKPVAKTPSTTQLQPAALIPGSSKDGVLAQRLTSTSLILFEDVDIVFDEDKGFLSAIATFLKTTKRPIILTTSDGRFPEMFEERCEMVTFRKPPSLQLVTHLQLLCLAENVYASHSNLRHVVSLLDRDVRRCWLAAQFWVSSGAGQISHNSHRRRTPDLETSRDENRKAEEIAKGPCGSPAVDYGDGSGRDKKHHVLPRLQSGCFESFIGLCNQSGVGSDVLSMLKDKGSCLRTRSTIAETFQKEDNASVYFRNIQSLLPTIVSGHSSYANWESSINQSPTESKAKMSNGRTVPLLNHKLIMSLAAFADNMSFLDSQTFFPRHDGKGPGNSGWWGVEAKPTLALDRVDSDKYNFAKEETSSSIGGFLEAASFDRCHRNYEKTVEQFKQLDQSARDNGCRGEMQTGTPLTNRKADEVPTRPEQDGKSCLKLQQDDCTKCPELYPALVSKLPLLTRCNHRVLATDYLPTIRCVCRSEQIREEMKIKRRFLHYLDSVSLNLKKTDQITLCSIMEVKQRTRRDDKPREKQDGEIES